MTHTQSQTALAKLPDRIHIREVGLRDGLQNEQVIPSTDEKEVLVRKLVAAGLTDFELTSFVSPKAVPALADADELTRRFADLEDIHFSALVANQRGAERAMDSAIDSIVLFVSASESHNKKNVNRSIDASLKGFDEIANRIQQSNSPIKIRAAIATAFGCPFEGDVDIDSVMRIAKQFVALGAENISLGDTTGMATPRLVADRVTGLSDIMSTDQLTLHFHNTRGIGLVNAYAGMQLGIRQFESSIGGLGGCPFAPGASGNIASEDLLYLLNESAIQTGIDLDKLIEAALFATRLMGKDLPAQVSKAGPRLKTYQTDSVRSATG